MKQHSITRDSRSDSAVGARDPGTSWTKVDVLCLSFWDICLDNLPEGTFTRRRLTPEEARERIENARGRKALMCLSADDLLAPYQKRRCDNHKALCRVLHERFGISLEFSAFFTEPEEDGYYFTRPLNLAQVESGRSLLVVTCMFALPDRKKRAPGRLALTIDPTSVEFHLFQFEKPL